MRNAQSIFFEAMDLDPSEWGSYLDRVCADNVELRADVERLLHCHDRSEAFLEQPFVQLVKPEDTPVLEPDPEENSGTDSSSSNPLPTIPGYELVEVLARGGMGVVYQARQLQANRIVALKMISKGDVLRPEVLERFRIEAETLARLQHPGIVQIFEVGTFEDTPFFSMEFCLGGSLSQYMTGQPIQAPQAAALLHRLALAVDAAHRAEVIHRDLKPENILVTQPLSKANLSELTSADLSTVETKVTDFGLAKKLDDTPHTRTGLVMGTPSYMSPEQARGEKELGPGTDVYSLGVMLYELLSGRPPFKAATPFETVLQVIQDDPVPLSQLQSNVPQDLETICAKCLHKEPTRRYETAQALADDLQAFLDGKPIAARPIGLAERTVKWTKRNPALASSIAVAGVALLVLIVSGVSFTVRLLGEMKRTDQALERALEAEKGERQRALEAEARVYALRIQEAHRSWLNYDVAHARKVLEDCPPDMRGWEYGYLKTLPDKGHHILGKHETDVVKVCWSGDGRRIASGSRPERGVSGEVKIWDAATQTELASIRADRLRVYDLCFSPDARYLAITTWEGVVKLWNVEKGQVAQTIGQPTDRFEHIHFHPDGQHLVTSGKAVKVWDTSTGQALYEKKVGTDKYGPAFFSYDGQYLVTLQMGFRSQIEVWDALKGSPIQTIRVKPTFRDIRLSSETRLVAGILELESELKVWDYLQGKEISRVSMDRFHPRDRFAPPLVGTCLQFSPTTLTLACTVGDVIVLKNRRALRKTLQTLNNEAAVTSLCYSPDGAQLACGTGRFVRIWNPQKSSDPREVSGHLPTPWEGGRLVTSSPLAMCENSNLAAAVEYPYVRVWDLDQQKDVAVFKSASSMIRRIDFSRDGRYVVGLGFKPTLCIWDVEKSQLLHEYKIGNGSPSSVCLSPDNKRIATVCELPTTARNRSTKSSIQVWSFATGEPLLRLEDPHDKCNAIRYSPDGEHLATCGFDKTIVLWDPTTGKKRLTLEGHTRPVQSIDFSPDSKKLVSGSFDNTIKLWDVQTGELLETLEPEGTDVVAYVSFSPDGSRIVATLQKSVQLWDTRYFTHLLTLESTSHPSHDVRFSSDGRFLVSVRGERLLLWESTLESEK